MKTLLTAALVATALIGGLFVVATLALVILTVAFYRRLTSPASVVSPRPAGRHAIPAVAEDEAIDVVATELPAKH
ncbi:MAG TPA: hypothetical protein VG710_06495 [Opitutus sp.]|nr:hypothetical protein [Opitutus sp.]